MVRLPQTPQQCPKVSDLSRKQQHPQNYRICLEEKFSQEKERNAGKKNENAQRRICSVGKMASKKREIQLQAVINNQRLWDEMLQNKGLTVIDVYQAWCGPCKAMQTLFRKLKNEAEADSIVTLQPFRDKCEPVFLFSVDGKIIAKIKGANAPLVNQKVISLINEEKKIAAGEMDRPQYQEIAFVDSDTEDAGEAPYENVGDNFLPSLECQRRATSHYCYHQT
ncbi:Thioredoxin Domain-Containing Protein 3 [Manis pentadactyla]|nr:Thioredoxin Domain-Containing Protein 3 [Manis pentadactyla]